MGISVDGITSLKWARKLWRFSGKDGVVDYWINDTGKFGKLAMSRRETRFVRNTFRELDRITGLRFRERSRPRTTDVDVHCTDDLGSGVLGSAVLRNGWFDVLWRDQGGWDLTRGEKWTIRHELGHVLGLDHPYGNGFNRRYDSADTVMSYNDAGAIGYTASDVQALQQLW
jgi:hypothetical protein